MRNNRQTSNENVSHETPEVTSKAHYHHGDLRGQLVKAATQLVDRHGADHFKLAEACRLAGVSTAAPYRHFADKNELLYAVISDGFWQLQSETSTVAQDLGPGSIKSIAAIGTAYVHFAIKHPNLFKMMFSFGSDARDMQDKKEAGYAAYQVLLDNVAAYLGIPVQEPMVNKAAFPLWNFVHGLSFILIDNNLAVANLGLNHEDFDINAYVSHNTKALLSINTVIKPHS